MSYIHTSSLVDIWRGSGWFGAYIASLLFSCLCFSANKWITMLKIEFAQNMLLLVFIFHSFFECNEHLLKLLKIVPTIFKNHKDFHGTSYALCIQFTWVFGNKERKKLKSIADRPLVLQLGSNERPFLWKAMFH